MYDDLVKALRGCVLSKPCDGCPYYDPNGPSEKCATMNIAAADAIEELQELTCELLFRVGQAEALIDYYQTGRMTNNEPPKEDNDG